MAILCWEVRVDIAVKSDKELNILWNVESDVDKNWKMNLAIEKNAKHVIKTRANGTCH